MHFQNADSMRWRKKKEKREIKSLSFAPSANIKQEQIRKKKDNLTIHPSLSVLDLCVNLA